MNVEFHDRRVTPMLPGTAVIVVRHAVMSFHRCGVCSVFITAIASTIRCVEGVFVVEDRETHLA